MFSLIAMKKGTCCRSFQNLFRIDRPSSLRSLNAMAQDLLAKETLKHFLNPLKENRHCVEIYSHECIGHKGTKARRKFLKRLLSPLAPSIKEKKLYLSNLLSGTHD